MDNKTTKNLCIISSNFIPLELSHAYQSLSCATPINIKFKELFSPKHVYVKYKNGIWSHRVALFAH